ncbi:MAG: hypothetical protein NZM04_01770, partial [Methylacidiphilales bacterium]|nr:hypothetical protein [Candidatus Methylacidiphilales bacterium]
KEQDFGNCGLACNQVFLYLMLSGQAITEKQLSKIGLSKEIVMDEKRFLDWSINNGYANWNVSSDWLGSTFDFQRQKFFSDLGIQTTYNDKPKANEIIQAVKNNKGVQIAITAGQDIDDNGIIITYGHAVTAQQVYKDKNSGKTYVVINNSGWSPNGLAPTATQAVAIDDLMKMQPRIIVTEPKLWGIHSVKADRPSNK